MSLAAQEALVQVSYIASDLRHPAAVWMSGDACDVHGAAADVDKEQHVVPDQASERTDLGGGYSPIYAPRVGGTISAECRA